MSVDPALLAEAQTADEILCRLARVDPNAFMEYVMEDESTGAPLVQAPIHLAFQNLASEFDRLLVWAHIESGKTNQLSIGRTLWEIGRNPSLRVGVVSNTHDQAAKVVRSIAKYIEDSEKLHRVFPDLKKAEPWTSHALFVQRPTTAKDPTVQSCGIHGNITGARIDLLILDDVLDYENCRTPVLRQDLWDWYHATLAGRLTEYARVIAVGTAYHPDDFLHRLEKQPGWSAFRYPVIDPETGNSRWPDRWPMGRIEKKKVELGPLEFARQMLCQARDDAEARFKREWIDICLERGRGKYLLHGLESIPQGFSPYTGVDLGVKKKKTSGESVFFTILVHPDGTREVVGIESGKISGPDILNKIEDTHKRYGSILFVEDNAAQDFILQFSQSRSAVPVRPFTTGRNKSNPEFGVESIAAEMAAGKWIIPSGDGKLEPEVAEWVTEMLYYDPAAHTGDRLMASWFAREGARAKKKKAQWTRLDLMSR